MRKSFLCLLALIGYCAPASAQIVEGNEALSFMDPVNLQVAPVLQLPLQPPLPLKLNGRLTAVLPPAPQIPPHLLVLTIPEAPPRKRRKRKPSTASTGRLKAPFAGRPTIAQHFGVSGGAGKFTFNRGIDFASSPGSQVRAMDRGLVLYAGPFTNFGNIVVIGHGPNRRSRYLFLSEIAVKTGEQVSQGASLGKAGSAQIHCEYWLKISAAAWRAQDAGPLLKL